MKAAGRGRTIRVEDLTHLQLAQYLTDYIVIGPISTDLQRATGQLLCTYVAAIIAKKHFKGEKLIIHIQYIELLWIAWQAIQTVVCHTVIQYGSYAHKYAESFVGLYICPLYIEGNACEWQSKCEWQSLSRSRMYSGTSDKGPSAIGMTSLQRTRCVATPC